MAYKPDQAWGHGNQVVASYICPYVNHHKERNYAHPFDEGPTLLRQQLLKDIAQCPSLQPEQMSHKSLLPYFGDYSKQLIVLCDILWYRLYDI